MCPNVAQILGNFWGAWKNIKFEVKIAVATLGQLL